MKSMPGLNVKAALTQGGRAVRVLDLQFGSPEFKSRPERQLDLFSVAPSLTSRPPYWKQPTGLPPASWDSWYHYVWFKLFVSGICSASVSLVLYILPRVNKRKFSFYVTANVLEDSQNKSYLCLFQNSPRSFLINMYGVHVSLSWKEKVLNPENISEPLFNTTQTLITSYSSNF